MTGGMKMKKILTIALAAFMILSATSCDDQFKEDLAAIKARIVEMESLVNSINEVYASASKVIAALEDHDMIRSVTTIKKNDGDSYLITFASTERLRSLESANMKTAFTIGQSSTAQRSHSGCFQTLASRSGLPA